MKNAKRKKVIAALEKTFPGCFFKTSEEFYGDPSRNGGIWTGFGETSFKGEGLIYDCYSEFREEPECPTLRKFCEKYGVFCEPYDPGTIFVYEA